MQDLHRDENGSVTLPSDAEREMLRDSARGFLAQHWPVDQAIDLAAQADQVATIWRLLAGQGFGALGSEPSEGGLREILIVIEELGRAACPAPMMGAALANLALTAVATGSSAVSALLADLHTGAAVLAFSFGAFDGDANAGAVSFSNSADGIGHASGSVNGAVAFVEGAASATHLIVFGESPVEDTAESALSATIAIVSMSDPGVAVKATPGLSVPPLSTLTFSNASATLVRIPLSRVHDLNRMVRLGLAARSLGAANRAFELVVDYAKVRQQFGQLIGRFQAIQHKLANCLISLEGTRQTLTSAAAAYDVGSADWRLFASVAYASASPMLRQVSLETQHTFGAIGYAEEHEAPRHFRRTHGDLTRHGGVRRAREEVAAWLLDDARDLPDYDLGALGNAFRHEVRTWFAENWTEERRAAHAALPYSQRRHNVEFQRVLGGKGWFGIAWPKAYGGQERTLYEQLAYQEELEASEAPGEGASLQATSLIRFGTKAQQEKYLPGILHGTINFCLGYSEPDSGSDLASLRTSAVKDGDEWVINGQKIWNTSIFYANYIWLAVRTDPRAKTKQAGISMFIVPVDAPGITVKPSMAMYGRPFASVFFDNVRVPADALVGEINSGWTILTTALAEERFLLGASVNRTRRLFGRLARHLRTAEGGRLAQDPVLRERLGTLAAEIEVARRLLMHGIAVAESGKVPVYEAAMAKVYSGELMERFGETVLDMLGMGATLSENASGAIPDNGELEQTLRHSIMYVVGGGTGEIQRNLIALRGLGLPR